MWRGCLMDFRGLFLVRNLQSWTLKQKVYSAIEETPVLLKRALLGFGFPIKLQTHCLFIFLIFLSNTNKSNRNSSVKWKFWLWSVVSITTPCDDYGRVTKYIQGPWHVYISETILKSDSCSWHIAERFISRHTSVFWFVAERNILPNIYCDSFFTLGLVEAKACYVHGCAPVHTCLH